MFFFYRQKFIKEQNSIWNYYFFFLEKCKYLGFYKIKLYNSVKNKSVVREIYIMRFWSRMKCMLLSSNALFSWTDRCQVDGINDLGQTPLMCAITLNDLELVKLLMKAGIFSNFPLMFLNAQQIKHYLSV